MASTDFLVVGGQEVFFSQENQTIKYYFFLPSSKQVRSMWFSAAAGNLDGSNKILLQVTDGGSGRIMAEAESFAVSMQRSKFATINYQVTNSSGFPTLMIFKATLKGPLNPLQPASVGCLYVELQ